MRIILFVLLIALPRLAEAAVGFSLADTISGHGITSLSIVSFGATGSGNAALCAVGSSNTPERPSGITWNGAAMTQIGNIDFGGTSPYWSVWRRAIGSSPGTHDFVVSFSGLVYYTVMGCSTYTGVDQATPNNTVNTDSGSGLSETVPTNGIAVDWQSTAQGLAAGGSCWDQNAGSGQTERWDICMSGQPTLGESSDRTTSGSFSWDADPTAFYMHMSTTLNAASATVTQSTRRRFQ